MKTKFFYYFRLFLGFSLLLALLTSSVWQPEKNADQVRFFTRKFEFDYLGWTLDALWNKAQGISLGLTRYLTYTQQRTAVRNYFETDFSITRLTNQLEMLVANPQEKAKEEKTRSLEKEILYQKKKLEGLALFAESILQDQASQTLNYANLNNLYLPLPPVLFHITDLPKNLILSPRDTIKQEISISLNPDMTLDDEIWLENAVENSTNYSALVVPVGGVSTYPSMVISTNNLLYLLETIFHEWTHHHLAFKPLGWRYNENAALRTMNESTAGISGNELGWMAIQNFYTDLIRSEGFRRFKTYSISDQPLSTEDLIFDYRKEMYKTRVEVEELLADGKIEEAEAFMETRRELFWEYGYQIRRLNQAYFAFYGAYADEPFSAAGADPVGEDIRLLRSRSRSLSSFLNRVSRMSSYSDLLEAVNTY